ncbi:MAG: CoA-binding protein [Bacteroidales bacterium]
MQAEEKLTVVIGASPNSWRFSNMCILKLRNQNIPVVAIGIKPGIIGDVPILTGYPEIKNVHTVSLYIGSDSQQDYYEYILSLKPRRIIFNPETYNPELDYLANSSDLHTIEACTMFLLDSGLF